MELAETITSRRSIRRFKEKDVPRELVEQILGTARWAPSGNNVQPWRFILVVEKDKIERLSVASNQRWIASSPMVIVCLSDLEAYGQHASYSSVQPLVEVGMIEDMDFSEFNEIRKDMGDMEKRMAHTFNSYINVSIIIDHITLLAHESGLGTCWVRLFNAAKVREILDITENYTIVALLPTGYPDESGRKKDRMDVEDLIIRWQ